MNALRNWRKSHSITLDEMAGKLGISIGSLSRIERGEQWPDRSVILRISQETNDEITANDLVGLQRAEGDAA